VLVTEEAVPVPGSFEFEPIEDSELKGLSTRVKIYRVTRIEAG
jgi:hypothetical protein